MNNVIFYGFQFAHHGKYSSFLAMKTELEQNGIRVISVKRPQIFLKRGFRRLNLARVWMKLQEVKLYRSFKNGSDRIIHYFFPENSLFNAPHWKGSNKLIITCHQPARDGYFEGLKEKNPYFLNAIKHADVIILMASCDIQIYREYAPQAKIFFIPHGVDVNYFSRDKANLNDKNDTDCMRVLTVGNWLRDYAFWAEVVKDILRCEVNIRFTVIAGMEAQNEIRRKFDNSLPEEIQLLSGISDDALRDCYARADLMFLPLLDSWANNAILEAGSMGLPIMVTDLPSVREYLTDSLAIYFKNDSAETISKQLQSILKDKARRKSLGNALRKHVESKLSWHTIAERHIELYSQINNQVDETSIL